MELERVRYCAPDSLAADEILIFGSRRKLPSVLEALLDEMWEDRIRGEISVLTGRSVQETAVLGRHAYDLMSLPVNRRRKAVRNPPFRDLSVADVLLADSARYAQGCPEESEQRAVAAEWIASLPWPQARERAARIRARALMAQGNFRRHCRDWQGAELRFGSAFAVLRELPVGYDHEVFCDWMAQLREDQSRLGEAALLVRHSMQLHNRQWWGLPSSSGLFRLACIALKQDDAWRAMAVLAPLAVASEDLRSSEWEQAQFALIFAICFAAVGLGEQARKLLVASADCRRVMDRKKRLPLEWLEYRISLHLGDLDRALPRLEALRRWLIFDHADLGQVCLCSIDLALAYTKTGQLAKHLPSLLEVIAEQPGAVEHPWALGALWWYRDAVERGMAPATAARRAAEIVHRRESSLVGLVSGRSLGAVAAE